jgi:hypothetical protein
MQEVTDGSKDEFKDDNSLSLEKVEVQEVTEDENKELYESCQLHSREEIDFVPKNETSVQTA